MAGNEFKFNENSGAGPNAGFDGRNNNSMGPGGGTQQFNF